MIFVGFQGFAMCNVSDVWFPSRVLLSYPILRYRPRAPTPHPSPVFQFQGVLSLLHIHDFEEVRLWRVFSISVAFQMIKQKPERSLHWPQVTQQVSGGVRTRTLASEMDSLLSLTRGPLCATLSPSPCWPGDHCMTHSFSAPYLSP